MPRALGGKTDDSGPGDKAATVRPSRHGFHMLGRAGPRGWGRERVNVRVRSGQTPSSGAVDAAWRAVRGDPASMHHHAIIIS